MRLLWSLHRQVHIVVYGAVHPLTKIAFSMNDICAFGRDSGWVSHQVFTTATIAWQHDRPGLKIPFGIQGASESIKLCVGASV